MRICILLDSYEESDSPSVEMAADGDAREYFTGHECQVARLSASRALQQVQALPLNDFDVFLNLYDGCELNNFEPGLSVVRTLHSAGAAYTGADPQFWQVDRRRMKAACAAQRVPTPGGYFIDTAAQIPAGVQYVSEHFRFPVIIKHPFSFASIGLTPDSRVETPDLLPGRVQAMFTEFGAALIEEFVDGREFTALVVENPDDPRQPVVYEPVEFRFPPGETFKHYHLKWYDFEDMSTARCADPALAKQLQDSARRLFLGLKGSGYARMDFRVDADGTAYVVDVNPNCGIFYPRATPGSADFILLNDPGGHAGFVDLILRAALQRAGRPEGIPVDVREDEAEELND